MVCCLESPGPLAEEIEAMGIPLFALGKRPGVDFGAIWRLSRLLREQQVDIVHMHNRAVYFQGVLGAKLARTPVLIYTKHGRNYARQRHRRWMNAWCNRQVDMIVAVSEDVRKVLLEIEKMPPDRVVTIVNGIDICKYAAARMGRDELRAEMGLPPGEKVMGIVARLSPEKDHDNLLQAFAQVWRADGNITLLIVGDGKLRDHLESLARQLGVSDKTRFLGSRSDVARLLGVFDVFVLSSITEGTSLTILEAMAAGLPVVATDVGGNSALVADGETGFLVSPRNPDALAWAILKVLSDPGLAQAMGEAGQRRAEAEFGREAMARRYEAVYEKAMALKTGLTINR